MRPTEDSRASGANASLLRPHFSCSKLQICPWPPSQPVAGRVPSCLPSQATTDNGRTHSDQLIMLPMTSSTMRSWREAETRGLRRGKRDVERSGRRPTSAGPQPSPGLSQAPLPPEGLVGAGQVPRRAARCTAGCSLYRAHGGCGGRSPSLQGGGKALEGLGTRPPRSSRLAAGRTQGLQRTQLGQHL